MLGLLGPNGAGKSTLMRILATITRPLRFSLRPALPVGIEIEATAEGITHTVLVPAEHEAAVLASLRSGLSRARVTALVGHEFRWAKERAVLGRAIADGWIGEPRFATMVQYVPLVADPEVRMPAWWFDRSLGGGWLGASGSHLVDQARVWLGEFTTVSAATRVVTM